MNHTPTPFVVVMRNAVGPDSRKGDAYIGQDLRFSTANLSDARGFDEFDAERFADHWRGYYHGFHGGVVIDILDIYQKGLAVDAMTHTPTPFENPEYWLARARDERAFAATKRQSRFGTVESILIHERNAAEYEQRAAALAKVQP